MGSCCSRSTEISEPLKSSDKTETATQLDRSEIENCEVISKQIYEQSRSSQNLKIQSVEQQQNAQEDNTEKLMKQIENYDLRSQLDFSHDAHTQISNIVEKKDSYLYHNQSMGTRLTNQTESYQTKEPIINHKQQQKVKSQYLDLQDECLMEQIVSEDINQLNNLG